MAEGASRAERISGRTSEVPGHRAYPGENRGAKERDASKELQLEGDGYYEGEMVYDEWICPNCGECYELDYDDYDFCPNCGLRILR